MRVLGQYLPAMSRPAKWDRGDEFSYPCFLYSFTVRLNVYLSNVFLSRYTGEGAGTEGRRKRNTASLFPGISKLDK